LYKFYGTIIAFNFVSSLFSPLANHKRNHWGESLGRFF
jgi:hypothetical protein